MKNLLLLLLATIFLVSCEDLETNSPALQAQIDNVLFKALDANASQNNDGTFLVQGFTGDETVSLKMSNIEVGTYNVGGTSNNYATYQNIIGSLYTTNPEGSGEVIITDRNTSINAISGTFNFTAMVPGVDTVSVHNGVFFEVRYAGGNGNNENDGTMVAKVDNVPLNTESVNAAESDGSIVVLGSDNTSSIFIKVPIDVEAGSYDLPENGFSAKYTLNSVEENATAGTIVVISHDISAKTLAGTFFFTTENHVVEQGQFNISYQ